MTVDYRLLGLALLLLWFPRQWLRFGDFRSGNRGAKRQRDWSPTGQREPGDVSIWIREEIRKPRNWVDLLRALAGGIAVGQFAFTLAPEVPKNAALALGLKPVLFLLGLKAGILAVGLLVQTLRFEGKATLFAAIFYLQGLGFGLVGWKVALFALAAVWAINTVLPSAPVFLFVYAALSLCFCMIYRVPKKELLLLVGLAMLPGALSLVFKRRLAQFTKKTKIIDSSGKD